MNKKDLFHYIDADKKATGEEKEGVLKEWAKRIFNSEKTLIRDYLITLRKLEYLHNIKKNPFQYLRYVFVLFKYRRKCIRLLINVPVNVAGPGLKIHHLGPITINKLVRIGSNCTLQPGVVIGQTKGPDSVPVIGDDVYFAPGAKVFGNVKVGNNVIIAPNSVVIKDVPDNCVVSGVPAKIIKMNGMKIE